MSGKLFIHRCWIIGAAALLGANAAFAQDPGPRLLENLVHPPAHVQVAPSIRVDVNLVLVPVTVTDLAGRVVNGLGEENFQVFDDSVPQKIVSLSNDDVPTSVGVVFDISGSMKDKMPKARLAVRAFSGVANPEDEAFLVTFANRPQLVVDFTSNFADIQSGLLFAKPGGTTALVDAVYLALHRMRSAHNTRKALLVITDGGDNNSRYSERELRNLAVEADVQIYAIGIHDNPGSAEEMNGPSLLESLAELTGGLHFSVEDTGELPDVAAKIGVALHDEYVIGYYPPANSLAEKWRKIRIKMVVPKGLPPLQVYARTGYYPPAH